MDWRDSLKDFDFRLENSIRACQELDQDFSEASCLSEESLIFKSKLKHEPGVPRLTSPLKYQSCSFKQPALKNPVCFGPKLNNDNHIISPYCQPEDHDTVISMREVTVRPLGKRYAASSSKKSQKASLAQSGQSSLKVASDSLGHLAGAASNAQHVLINSNSLSKGMAADGNSDLMVQYSKWQHTMSTARTSKQSRRIK